METGYDSGSVKLVSIYIIDVHCLLLIVKTTPNGHAFSLQVKQELDKILIYRHKEVILAECAKLIAENEVESKGT